MDRAGRARFAVPKAAAEQASERFDRSNVFDLRINCKPEILRIASDRAALSPCTTRNML
jgi:hypothetical protein